MRQPRRNLKFKQAFILLPVILTLMVLATVAYLLSREGAINAGNVNREAQLDTALYVAQAGYNSAIWQLNRKNCIGYTDISSTAFGDHNYLAEFTDTTGTTLTAGSPVNIKVVGTLASGESYTINRDREKIYQYPLIAVTLQLGTDPGKDATLNSFFNNRNIGAAVEQRVSTVSDELRHQLIQFDLSSLPVEANIVSAHLELLQTKTDSAGADAQITVYRVTQSWVEGTKDGTGQPDGATWDTADGSLVWNSGSGGSYDATSVASIEITTANVVRKWNVSTLVQGWHQGQYANDGLLLIGSGSVFVSFASKENSTTANRPKLIITYSCECGISCGGGGLPPAKKIYWTNDIAEIIQRSNEDGSNVETVISGQFKVRGLDIDTVNGKIYWTSDDFIKRADLDGSNIETIFTTTTKLNFDVKLDVAGGKMYWTYDNFDNEVTRANLDGSSVEIINSSSNRPFYFSLDTTAGVLYVTEYDNNSISRMNLDGSNITTVVSGSGSGNIGNAIDTVNGKIYWTGGTTNNWIKRANLDGSSEETIINGQNSPQDITYDADNDRIYWTDAVDFVIRRANADGSNIETIVSTGNRPRGITIVNADDVPATIPSVCNGSFIDQFNTVSFSGNNGTITWSTSWLEVGESDGPGSGDIRVRNDESDYQLRLQDNDNGGEGVARQADLSGASSAILSLRYRRSGLDKVSDYVTVEISSSGTTGPWVERGRFSGSGNDSNYVSWSYTLEASELSANTAIRLRTSPTMGGSDRVYFDDIELQCLP